MDIGTTRTKKTKLTHVISDKNIGGAGILLSYLYEGLAEAYELRLLVPKGAALCNRLADGAAVTELPFCADTSFRATDAGLFYRYFHTHPTDILHTHATLSARVGGALAGVKRLYSTRHCTKGEPPRFTPMRAFLYTLFTDMTVSTANSATKDLLAIGVPKKRIVTIQNGVPAAPSITKQRRQALYRDLRLQEGVPVLGCLGRMEHEKGQDVLLRAAAHLKQWGIPFYLLLVGDGSQRQALEGLCAYFGLGEEVRFSGYTPRPWEYENLFTLNINPSRGTETSCLVTSECMSLGVPTVASDFGGNTEMITELENGRIFPSENAYALACILRELLEEPDKIRRMGQGAEERYRRQFSKERMLREYLALYG